MQPPQQARGTYVPEDWPVQWEAPSAKDLVWGRERPAGDATDAERAEAAGEAAGVPAATMEPLFRALPGVGDGTLRPWVVAMAGQGWWPPPVPCADPAAAPPDAASVLVLKVLPGVDRPVVLWASRALGSVRAICGLTGREMAAVPAGGRVLAAAWTPHW